MATLDELATAGQTTSVSNLPVQSISAGSGARVQTAQVIDNSEKLARDLGKLMGGVVKEHQKASDYAGRITGNDNLAEFSKAMDTLEAQYALKENLTSSDYAQKSVLEEQLFTKHMEKGSFGDNELANTGFKDTFAKPATNLLFKTKTTNAKKQFTLHAQEEETKVASEIDDMGSNATIDNINVWKNTIKNVNGDVNTVYTGVAKSNNVAVDEQYALSGGRGFNFQNADGSINHAEEATAFNGYYGNILAMDESGNISKVDGNLTDKAEATMINHWKSRTYMAKSTADQYNEKYHRTMDSSSSIYSQAKTGTLSSQSIGNNLADMTQAFTDADNYMTLKPSERNNAFTRITELQQEASKVKEIELDIQNMTTNFKSYLKDGKVINVFDELTQKNIEVKITAEQYKNVLTRQQENVSKGLLAFDMEKEGINAFNIRMTQLTNMENMSERESSFTLKFKDAYTSGTSTGVMSLNDTKLGMGYTAFKAKDVKLNNSEGTHLNNLSKIISNPDLDDTTKTMQIQTVTEVYKTQALAKEMSVEVTANIQTGLEDLASNWINADLAIGSNTSASQWVVATEQQLNAKNAVKDLKTVDIGGFMAWNPTDIRVIIPQALSERQFKSAYDKIINNHNENKNQDLWEKDVVAKSMFNKSTKQFEVELRTRANNVLVGTIDTKGAHFLQSETK